MSAEDDVRKASEHFYAALNRMANKDSVPMVAAWSHGRAVTSMHPIGGREVGWEAVKGSFDEVARLCSDGRVSLKDQLVRVGGDLAYEVGIERGHLNLAGHRVTIEQRVTNVYQREAGTWKIVHHHTDPSTAMLEVLGKLKSQAAK